jgi:hypothetical protein
MTEISYRAQKTIECVQDAGLDQNSIPDKENEFSELSNYAALHQALRILDDKNMHRLAQKLGVHIEDFESTLLVLYQI